jgi:hypothetical protein
MKNRFDLEDNIMRCWEIVDELEMISNQKELTVEQYSALVKSLQILYSLKFNELFKTFESFIENKDFE